MKIFIDYYLRSKDTGKTCSIRHTILTEEEILEYALKKLEEDWDGFERYNIEAQIDKVEI